MAYNCIEKNLEQQRSLLMSNPRLFPSSPKNPDTKHDKEVIYKILLQSFKESETNRLEEERKEIKELQKKFAENCQTTLLTSESELKLSVVSIIKSYNDLNSFLEKNHSESEAFTILNRFTQEIICLKIIPSITSREINEYAESMAYVKQLNQCLPDLDRDLDKFYKEKLSNIPFEFYKKLSPLKQDTSLEIEPHNPTESQSHCRIL